MLKSFYTSYRGKMKHVRAALKRSLTLAEKALYAHLYNVADLKNYEREEDYVNFCPDRVAMQDVAAQMALLQFMNVGKDIVAVPSMVHCDHLIQAYRGAERDIETAIQTNREVHDFLRDASPRYGIGFWKPGADIIRQVVLKNYVFPDGMTAGTGSHTPSTGGLGMVTIGAGGASAVGVVIGMEWEFRVPKSIGVRLTGELNGRTAPGDVILKLAGILTVKEGISAIIEYFGSGTASSSVTGKAMVCDMGTEVEATASLFPYDERMAVYLKTTGHEKVAAMASSVTADLCVGDGVMAHPEDSYDRVIEISLSELEPYTDDPFTPNTATPISEFARRIIINGYPRGMEVGLIGFCTNPPYQDINRAAFVARQVNGRNLGVVSPLIIDPGSEQIHVATERDGMMDVLEKMGATIMANACGPCIGQWRRHADDPICKDSIVTSFSRNFAKRADGNPNTLVFVVSPEVVLAPTIVDDLCPNPLKDCLVNHDGEEAKSSGPTGDELPSAGFVTGNQGYQAPVGEKAEIKAAPDSQRLQLLTPFPAWDGNDFLDMPLLIKVQEKCMAGHISIAGPWLWFRGHLENISDNMLMGAVNASSGETNKAWNRLTSIYETAPGTAKQYKADDISSIVVAEENYDGDSSCGHAAMESCFLNMKVILVRSFVHAHEINLKKRGMLAVTFIDKADYGRIHEHNLISIVGLKKFSPGHNPEVILHHEDGAEERFVVQHTYNEQQIGWFRVGLTLNAKQFVDGLPGLVLGFKSIDLQP